MTDVDGAGPRPSPARRPWTVRAQLAGAVVLALGLFCLAAGLLTANAYGQDREQVRRQLRRLAGAAAGELATVLDQTETLLEGIAAQEPVAALDPGRCQPVLQGFSGIPDGHLVLVDDQGATVCSSLPGREPGGRDYAGATWVEEVRRAGSPVHAEPVVDPVTGRSSLVLAVPAPPGGPPGAALGAVVVLDSLVVDLIGPLEQSRGTVLVILDATRRTVLAGSPAGLARGPLDDASFAPSASSASFEAEYPDDTRRLYHQATVPGVGWHVYAGLPTSVAFAPAREALGQAAVLVAVVFLVLVVLSALQHRQIVRPARALTSAILSARGNPGARPAPVRGPAELARIAVEFNALQEARVRDEEALRALNSELSERVAELDHTRAELQRALVHFTQVQEDQRRQVAQSIHDDLIQALTATLWALEDLVEDRGVARYPPAIAQARANLEAAVGSARELLFELRPPLLDELGLLPAVNQQLARLSEASGLHVALQAEGGGRLPAHIETLAFRTIEEALRHVRRRPGTTSVQVRLRWTGPALEVTVEDDGQAMAEEDVSSAARQGRAGIVSMRETITMAGGSFGVAPGPSGGTRLSFSLPVATVQVRGRN